jgi:signal transduction histidine kinase
MNVRERRMPAKGARLALIAGFGGVFVLMSLAGLDSIQLVHHIESVNSESDRLFIERTRALEHLRASFYLAGTYLRDYLLDTTTAGAQAHLAQIRNQQAEMDRSLQTYERGLSQDEAAAFADLKRRLDSYWRAVSPVLAWEAARRAREGLKFVTTDLLRWRIEVLRIADRIAELNESHLRAEQTRTANFFDSFRRRILAALALTLGLAVILAGGTITYILRLEGDLWRGYQENLRFQGELEQLSARLLSAQEEERRAIARELHDEVGQSMTALLVELSNVAARVPLGDAEQQDRLVSIRKLAEKSVGAVRNLSLLLRPSMLDDFGLVPALHWQAREMSRRTGTRVEVSADDVPDEFSDEHKTCVYRVVQEALHNCERHSQANQVHISFRQEPKQLMLSIQDNGKGFNPRQARGMGLLGMEERVRLLGGSFEIESKPGRGTSLRVVLPLAQFASRPTVA